MSVDHRPRDPVFPSHIVPFIRESEVAVRHPWRIADRRLLDYLLVGVDAGTCTVVVEGVAQELTPGDFALVQPGELHSFEALGETTTPYAHFDVFYNPRREESFPTAPGRVDLAGYEHLMQPRLNDLPGVSVPTRFRPSHDARFRELFRGMVTLRDNSEPLDRLEAQGLATELIALLLREFTASSRETHPPASLRWMTSYLSLRLGEHITVDDLAARAHLSPSRFAAVFRSQFGVPPHAYLTRLRIEHACSLLATTNTAQAEIARLCGFADAPHFSKVFRRVTGCVPGAYRHSVRARGAGVPRGVDAAVAEPRP